MFTLPTSPFLSGLFWLYLLSFETNIGIIDVKKSLTSKEKAMLVFNTVLVLCFARNIENKRNRKVSIHLSCPKLLGTGLWFLLYPGTHRSTYCIVAHFTGLGKISGQGSPFESRGLGCYGGLDTPCYMARKGNKLRSPTMKQGVHHQS